MTLDDREPTRLDVLVGRAVDGEASAADWREIDRAAEADPGVWVRLAKAQRAHARLERTVEDAVAISELVELPRLRAPSGAAGWKIGAAAGWIAAAAAVGLAVLAPGGPAKAPAPGDARASRPEMTPVRGWSADDAYRRYLDAGIAEGRVLGEIPAAVLRAELSESGAGDMIVVRRVVERRRVDELSAYRIEANEHGMPALLPAETNPAGGLIRTGWTSTTDELAM